MSYIAPAVQAKFETLSIDLKNEILERNVQINTIYDLIHVLEEIVNEGGSPVWKHLQQYMQNNQTIALQIVRRQMRCEKTGCRRQTDSRPFHAPLQLQSAVMKYTENNLRSSTVSFHNQLNYPRNPDCIYSHVPVRV